jgi:glycosyltransferase involved in cell wall biosynthesis
MRIAIATSGRFHVLDLARELDALGHDVVFYSTVPRARTRAFGLPDRCRVSLLPFMAPLALTRRLAPNAEFVAQWEAKILDSLVAALLKPCDLLIAMSGLFLKTLQTAKRRYGATVILERGSRHIVSQDRILRAMPTPMSVHPASVRRELQGYELADFISVPSHHVVESFLAFGTPASKLLRNPYGCDLDMFPATIRSGPEGPTILFVGSWSLQKGCDVLLDAWRSLKDVRLVHVGPLGDLALPRDEGFTHVPTVHQRLLSQFYAQSDLLVLPSRQDGLGLVMGQALACGLPVICTTMTGGKDLREMLNGPDAIFEVEPGDAAQLRSAILRGLNLAEGRRRDTPRTVVADRELLSWRHYGERYQANLTKLLQTSG